MFPTFIAVKNDYFLIYRGLCFQIGNQQQGRKILLKIFFFLMWTIFEVFIEFVTILLLFHVLVFWPQGMWDLSSLTRDLTHRPLYW